MPIWARLGSHAARFPRWLANAGLHHGVSECAAFPLRSTVHGDIPVLAVVARDGLDLDWRIAFSREKLGIRAPRKIVRVAPLPRNGAGKVAIGDLQDMFGAEKRQVTGAFG